MPVRDSAPSRTTSDGPRWTNCPPSSPRSARSPTAATIDTIVARYGRARRPPAEETWNSTELLYEIGRAFGMLGNEEKVERYLLRCAELAPRRAAVFHCAIGWYFQRKKKWTASGHRISWADGVGMNSLP